MLKCKVCGFDYQPRKSEHYTSRGNGQTGLATVFGSNDETTHYDTFDCPQCGCQIVAQERKRSVDIIKKEESEEI